MIGSVIGPYRVEGELGRGGMGVVYAARHIGLNLRVAIKVLLPEYSGNRALLERFFSEARAAAASRHAGIVQILDANQFGSAAYIVMEFLEGESLATRIARVAPLAIPEVVAITRQIASALSTAHVAGVVHRDLKPDNIQIVPDADMPLGERAKILDFGIAKVAAHLTGQASRTRTGIVMGTPRYMSPEQCRGAGTVDHRADIYSLGCIVYEMLAGQPPFPGEFGEVIGAHQYQRARPVRGLCPAVPRALDRLVSSMLAKHPDERPPTAAAVVLMLDGLGLRFPSSERSPSRGSVGKDQERDRHTTMSAATGESSALITGVRRRPRTVVAASLTLVVALFLVGWVAQFRGGEPVDDSNFGAPAWGDGGRNVLQARAVQRAGARRKGRAGHC